MRYDEKLPRRVKGNARCQHLDDDGNRCKKKARVEEYLFEDPARPKRRWVTVCFCSIHSRYDADDIKDKK